jgi:hypothetical protein
MMGNILKALALFSALANAHTESNLLNPDEMEMFRAHYGNISNVIDENGIEHLSPDHDLGPGWPVVGNETIEKAREIAADSQMARDSFPMITQPVSFVNFYKKDGTGKRPYIDFVNQVKQLNNAYSGSEAGKGADTRIRFELAGVRYVQNDDYFNYCALPTIIAKSRPRYMMDGSRHLNVYVCWCQSNLGLSWLPYDSWYRQSTDETHYALGTIIHHELLPGNNFKGGLWKQGDILTHEVGHFYGLKHPYQGDCDGSEDNSDQIADTPRMTGNPLATCKSVSGRDSCRGSAGKDDMNNYMVATEDTCRNHFTPGQIGFMQSVIRKYKPTLMKQVGPSCVASIDGSDNSPDLQPCLDGTLQVLNGKQWCKTDPDNDNVWAWACCPSSGGNWENDSCRQGTPSFDTPRNSPSTPRVRAASKIKSLRQ